MNGAGESDISHRLMLERRRGLLYACPPLKLKGDGEVTRILKTSTFWKDLLFLVLLICLATKTEGLLSFVLFLGVVFQAWMMFMFYFVYLKTLKRQRSRGDD